MSLGGRSEYARRLKCTRIAREGGFALSERPMRTPPAGSHPFGACAVLSCRKGVAESWCAFWGNVGLLHTEKRSVIRQLSILDRARFAPPGWPCTAEGDERFD